ncbi:DUF5696 domain-containing protein [Bacillus sp. JJ722]|uniref:DUF5696 domain-containing protein n=1 Tax=Bacillus sp. JJ722 TaxID=3122973 RepID=UPI002FFDDCED
MYRKILLIIVACSLVAPSFTLAAANDLKYSSNAYTQAVKKEAKVVNLHNLDGFEKYAENTNLELYVEEEAAAIKLRDKRSGYIWSSTAPNMKGEKLNNTWENFINSALTIEYIDSKEKIKKENILDNSSRVKIQKRKNGFEADVRFMKAKIQMTLIVTLTEDGISIEIPKKSIKELGKNRLATVQVYPFLGSTKQDVIPGYMFIPDGTGALIRFQNQELGTSTPYIASVYNKDRGFENKTVEDEKVLEPEQIHFPVYGIVHGEKQHALMTTIKEGQHYAELEAYPSGVSTEFNWITPTFSYRSQYFQPTSKDMKGINAYQKEMNDFDINMQVKLLTNKEADYVGMAQSYQQDLIDQGLLKKKTNQEVNMRLEFLGAERKEGLLFDSVLKMTSIEDMQNIIKDLQKDEIANLEVTYRGWSKGGFSDSFPNKMKVEREIGSKKDLQSLSASLKKDDIPFSLYMDYTRGDEGGKGYSGKNDVAKKISVGPIENKNNDYISYVLSPKKSLDLFTTSEEFIKDVGVSGISMDSIGSKLFSDFNKENPSTRLETQKTYEKIGKKVVKDLNHVALYKPNDYMLPYSDVIYDVPMNSSRYQFFTDTVPFVPIVLKGSIDYFAPFSNFFADTDDVLKMIEYGAFPSFYLTKEPTFELQHTGLRDLYTTKYSTWKEEMVKQYELVQQHLAPVQGEEIIGRTVLQTGVVKVDYSNGISMVINYTEEDYKNQTYSVGANEVISVKGE